VSRVARAVLDEHFPTSLHPDILTKVGLDVGVAERPAEPYAGRTRRDPGFAPAVLRVYEYRCAVCAYDGQVGKISVGIEAAHLKWFSHGGPDVAENSLSPVRSRRVALGPSSPPPALLGATTASTEASASSRPNPLGSWKPLPPMSTAPGRSTACTAARSATFRSETKKRLPDEPAPA
jgi:hypothetical protein